LRLVERADRCLFANGIVIPTFDPREPGKAVGFIRQQYTQNQHAFVTAPAGLACAADIGEQERIVITDGPFLGLRLAQAGARGVFISDAPDVLPPLREWLAGKSVCLAAYKR